jgi:XTP/dITP diphosphohydrolase
MNIIFATQNLGKSKEVKHIFSDTQFNVVSLRDLGNNIEVEETGVTFQENSILKAKSIYEIYKVPVIADDSGLEIQHLDGRPGVYSARYAGENCTYDDNNNKVLSELSQFEEPYPAKFICYAVYYDGQNLIESIGELPGKITKDIRGTKGFGYDPIFIPDGFENTLAELDLDIKNKISHRGKAFENLKKLLSKV